MPTIDTLHELLKHELKDLYSAEVQIISALPALIKTASDGELKKALQQHLAVTKTQKKRLEDVQKLLGEEHVPEKKGFFANLFNREEGEQHCKAMEGLVKEGNALLGEDMKPEVMDAAIIAAAQKIEHYEISSYGTARAYALQLQLNKVTGLLEQTLKEEYEADNSLTALALSKKNLEAENESIQTIKATTRKVSPKTAKKASSKKTKAASPKKSSSGKKAKSAKGK